MEHNQMMYENDKDAAVERGRKMAGGLTTAAEYAKTPVGAAVALNASLPWYIRAGGALIGFSGLGRWTGAARRFMGKMGPADE
jgi:hypothetical protein